MTIIKIRPFRNGWQVFESADVEPVFTYTLVLRYNSGADFKRQFIGREVKIQPPRTSLAGECRRSLDIAPRRMKARNGNICNPAASSATPRIPKESIMAPEMPQLWPENFLQSYLRQARHVCSTACLNNVVHRC